MNHSADLNRPASDRSGHGSATGHHRSPRRSPHRSDEGGRRGRNALRSLRCHDARCSEADEEIREAFQRA